MTPKSFRRAVVLIAVIVSLVGLNLADGDAAEPILKLALQRADMPATTEKPGFGLTYPEIEDPLTLRPFGAREVAHYRYQWPGGGTIKDPVLGSVPKSWVLEGYVFRSADENGAKRLFALGKAARTGHFADFPPNPKALALPSYGDDQISLVATHPGTGTEMMVFVRTGSIVWQMRVAAIPLQFQPTQAEMLAVLQTYAGKQKARVAAG